MKIVICGLSITSSWGNGHATTYRGLVQGLVRLGHEVLFLERDKPWYAANRDMAVPPAGKLGLYESLDDLHRRFRSAVSKADFVMVGSFVPEGVAVAEWVLETAGGTVGFYDIDTPVTLAKLRNGDEEYLTSGLISQFDLYCSFTGGPTLKTLERDFGARMAVPLYCSVDPAVYFPVATQAHWEIGYLGTYSEDRQPGLEALMLEPARRRENKRFVVAGALYPEPLSWPANVERIEHLPPSDHRNFYNAQKFTLNITRRQMVEAGYSPSVRLFEAAACGIPVIGDHWPGIEEILEPGREILIASSTEETLDYLENISPVEARRIGERARKRILAGHTSQVRSSQLEKYICARIGARRRAHASAAD